MAVADVPDRVPFIDQAAVVSGLPAVVIDRVLADAFSHGAFRNYPPEALRTVRSTAEAIRLAARAWQRRNAVPDVSANGSPETSQPETVGHSRHEHVSIDAAAGILGLSDRRIRQLAPTLGVKSGGRWLLDADLVAAELERRSEGGSW